MSLNWREIDAILARYPEARFFPFLIGANDVLNPVARTVHSDAISVLRVIEGPCSAETRVRLT